MKSKIITLCSIITSNLLILTIAFEISSRLFLFDYIDSKLNRIIHQYQFEKNTDDHSISVPHPYLGYTRLNKNENLDIINEEKQEHQDPIAVFGGSVAENFYRFNKEKNLLQESLKETFNLKDNFGIKNYALGGYKQPQQLIASILFRPKVKVTINIEGYNEINETGSQFPHYYPMVSISKLYYSGVKNWDIYLKAKKTRASQEKLKNYMGKDRWFKFIPTFLKTLYFLKEKYLVWLEKKFILQTEKGRETDPFKSLSFSERIIYWLEQSCEQQNFLAKRGVKAYFFFQPLPFVPQSKKELTNNEKQMIQDRKYKVQVIWESKYHVQNMIDAYLTMRKLIKKENLSLNLVDLSQIFLDEPREIFIDGCCHFNKLGHSLLTHEIVKVIKETYSKSEKPKLCHDDFQSLVEKFR